MQTSFEPQCQGPSDGSPPFTERFSVRWCRRIETIRKSSLCVCGTIPVLTSFEQWQTEGGGSMRNLLMSAAALHLAFGVAIAQPAASPGPLSLDQQNKISEVIADQTPQPLTNITFSVAPDVVVPMGVILQRLPGEAEALAPQLRGHSYLAVDELVAIVDTNSRKIISVMQRMRRQENQKSG
jgi:hypothetical protein